MHSCDLALFWRHKMDCRRNAIHTIGIHAFDHRMLQGQRIKDVVKMLLDEKKIDVYRDVPAVFVYGTFAKRSLVDATGLNPKTGEQVAALRTRIENRVFDWRESATDRILMTMAKYWDNSHPKSVCLLDDVLPTHQLPPVDFK
jgi:hypothetical protein